MEIEKIIKNLQEKRKIFFSERDFQFALAWEIQKEYNDAKVEVLLEYPLKNENNNNEYVDIVVKLEGKTYPIELKYKTTLFEFEEYKLKDQSAQDCGRYD